jgi:hypothetical protein
MSFPPALPPDPAVRNCRFVPVRGASDPRGTVNFLEVGREIGFAVRRAFWIHGVPEGQPRGQHGHRQLELLLLALAGSCDVVVDDGANRRTLRLERPDLGLYVGPFVWHELLRFAPGTVVLALASAPYDEADYIRDYASFRREIAARD